MTLSKTVFAAVALIALTGTAVTAHAATVEETTIVKQVDQPGVKTFDLKSFDTNHDGIITLKETGDSLFFMFDLNSDGILDNLEYTKKSVLTVIPVERQTFVFRDGNDDGHAENGSYDYNVYAKKSGLAIFDTDNTGGISPKDFVKASFLEMDTNDSKVIEPDEWRAAYVQERLPKIAQQDTYNR